MIAFEELIYLFSTPSNTRGISRLNFNEAAMLYKYVKKTGMMDVIEIGCWNAGTTIVMAAASPGIVYSIDIRKRPQVAKNLKSFPSNNIELIHGDSSEVGKQWSTPVSLVFVDGDHTLKEATKDVLAWKDHIFPGGYIVLHDVIVYGEKKIDKMIRHFNLKELLPLLEEEFECVDNASSLVVLRKRK